MGGKPPRSLDRVRPGADTPGVRALQQGWQIAATELRVEWRSRRVLSTMLLLSTLTVLVFAFAADRSGLDSAVPAFWVALGLAATAGTVQWAARTHDSGVATAWLCAGVGRGTALSGRILAMVITLAAVALPLALGTGALFDALTPTHPGWLLVDLLLGAVALTALGAALQPLLRRERARLGGLLMLPLAAPVLLVAGAATRADFLPARAPAASLGLGLLAGGLLAMGALAAVLGDRGRP